MTQDHAHPPLSRNGSRKVVQTRIQHQLFGFEVSRVQDVLQKQEYTPIPLAQREVLGMINLRGRIVTIISLRNLLGLSDAAKEEASNNIVVEQDGDLYSFVVDSVAEIIDVGDEQLRRPPDNLSSHWKELSAGIYPSDKELMVVLDVDRVFAMLTGKKN